MKNFSKLCTPAKIYFAIAAIATLFDLLNGVSIMLAFWKLVFAFIWTFILGGLCDKGYKSISWFLVLLPYILMFLGSLNIYHVTEDQRQFMRSIQLQGAFGQEAFTEGAVSRSAVQTATQTAAQNVVANLRDLSPSEVSDLVTRPITSASGVQEVNKIFKTINKSSLEKIQIEVIYDIDSLKKNLLTAPPSRKSGIERAIAGQSSKLTAIINEKKKRP
jgi:hypothetical protein